MKYWITSWALSTVLLTGVTTAITGVFWWPMAVMLALVNVLAHLWGYALSHA